MNERFSSVMAKAWARADAWNQSHPVDSKVRVCGEGIKPYETVTRSAAFVWGSGIISVCVAHGPVHVPSLDQLEPL